MNEAIRIASAPASAAPVHRPGRGRKGLACWIARPAAPRPGAAPLVAIHGISRQADLHAALFAPAAAAQGRTVIAPLFNEDAWPGYQRLVARGRADLALLSLLEELRVEGVIGAGRIALVGYSGGAQFAHRFAMLYPHLIERLCVASAGWWTFPDAAPFPYGLGGVWGARLAAGLPGFLALPVTVCVGEDDNAPDENTRSGPAIDAQQGRDRLTRARRWADALHAAATARGIAPRVSFAILPGAGHDVAQCVRSGGLARHALPGEPDGADFATI
jgi:pimeloyl-ACP methyl ester carboxylesterase